MVQIVWLYLSRLFSLGQSQENKAVHKCCLLPNENTPGEFAQTKLGLVLGRGWKLEFWLVVVDEFQA